MANKRHIRLNDLRDAQKLLKKLINERYRDELETGKARDIGYLLKVFIEAYEKSDLEKRIEALEQNLSRKNNVT